MAQINSRYIQGIGGEVKKKGGGTGGVNVHSI
jgi:hypothetical protein